MTRSLFEPLDEIKANQAKMAAQQAADTAALAKTLDVIVNQLATVTRACAALNSGVTTINFNQEKLMSAEDDRLTAVQTLETSFTAAIANDHQRDHRSRNTGFDGLRGWAPAPNRSAAVSNPRPGPVFRVWNKLTKG